MTITVLAASLQADPSSKFDYSKYGLLAWSQPIDTTLSATNLTLGRLTVSMVILNEDATVSNIWYRTSGAPTTPTAGQCFAGIYSAAGTLLATTADISGNLTASTIQTRPLVTPVDLTAGDYYVGMFINASVTGFFNSTGANSLLTFGQTTANGRCMNANASLTTALPASLSNLALATTSIWFGLS